MEKQKLFETEEVKVPKESRHFSLEQGISDIVGAFTDPILVFPGGWGDTLPDWIKTQITLERLAMNMKALKGEKMTATDAEATAYLYTASLTAPFDESWTKIYLYVAGKEFTTKAGNPVPEDIKVDKLTDYQAEQLRELKEWIYRQRIKVRKQKEGDEKAKAKLEVEAKAPKQLRLWG